MALSFHTKVGAGLLERDLQLSALDEPAQDLLGRATRIGAEQGLGAELVLGIADQHPAHRDNRHPAMAPDGGCCAEFNEALALAVPALDQHRLPARGGASQQLGQVREPGLLGAGSAVGSGQPGRCRIVERRIEPQARDAGDLVEGETRPSSALRNPA